MLVFRVGMFSENYPLLMFWRTVPAKGCHKKPAIAKAWAGGPPSLEARRADSVRRRPQQKARRASSFDGRRRPPSLSYGGRERTASAVARIKKPAELRASAGEGGEGGIRTRDTLSSIHTFQACSFNHSDTSPCFEGCKNTISTSTARIFFVNWRL